MIQYDLTATRLFDACSRESLPTEAEMFALTVALLLIREAAYSDLHLCDLVIVSSDVEDLALCVETQLAPFARDLGRGLCLRERLLDFVGLRIAAFNHAPSAKPRAIG